MSFTNILMRSNLISKGCKLYYTHLLNLNKASKINNWKITSGKYINQNFIIATDKLISKKFDISLTSIYKYKKTLKSLGLIDTLSKFTTKTNQCKNYHFRQLTVIAKTLPKKLISKLLVYIKSIKNIKFTNMGIIPYFKKNLNNTFKNIHTKIKTLLTSVKKTKYNHNFFNEKDVQTVCNILNTYNIKFKKYEINHYIKMYQKSENKFLYTCKYCSHRKNIYSPLKYFIKVFESSYKPKTNLLSLNQREYDYNYLEKLLVNKFD